MAYKILIVFPAMLIIAGCNDSLENNKLLFDAIQDGDEVIVQSLLDQGVPVDQIDRHSISGETALTAAIMLKKFDMVKLLLNNGAQLDFTNQHGYEPLHVAAQAGDTDITLFLINAGADLHKKNDNDMRSPIELAAGSGNSEVGHVLKKAGASVDFAVALGINDVDFVRKSLLTDRELASQRCKIGLPIDIAARFGYTEMAAVLIEFGVDVNMPTFTGATPLNDALRFHHNEIAKLLLEKGADPNVIEEASGNTSLHIAIERKNLAALPLLLQNGANPEIVSLYGKTAQQAADEAGVDLSSMDEGT